MSFQWKRHFGEDVGVSDVGRVLVGREGKIPVCIVNCPDITVGRVGSSNRELSVPNVGEVAW